MITGDSLKAPSTGVVLWFLSFSISTDNEYNITLYHIQYIEM